MLYIVDGYNVLFSSSFRMWVRKYGLHSARLHLINYIRSKLRNFLIVFDGREGYPQMDLEGVVFTKGRSADDYIKEIVRKHSKSRNITVITNDRSLASYVANMGVRTLRVDEILKLERRRNVSQAKSLSREEVERINEELKKLWGLL